MIKLLFLLPLLLVVSIIGLSFYLQPSDITHCGDRPDATVGCHKADAVIVVSGGDTIARTQAGIDMYKRGWADAVVFSGAAQDKTGPSNAAAMRAQALDERVPEQAIFVDEYSETTQQNAENLATLFTEKGWKEVILVTSGYHQRRASLELKSQVAGITIRNAPLFRDKDWSPWWWITPRGWWLAGGETVKIIVFHVRGGVL